MNTYYWVVILSILFTVSCGVDVKLKDSEHVVRHEFDFSGFLLDIEEFCNQAYETEEERDLCTSNLIDKFTDFVNEQEGNNE